MRLVANIIEGLVAAAVVVSLIVSFTLDPMLSARLTQVFGPDHDARQQRARPRAGKLASNVTLRRLVQRKLNRCWSPDEVCGWLRKTYPDDHSMRLCPETIYRELLLLRDNSTLHKGIA